jgi:hypothetical protein
LSFVHFDADNVGAIIELYLLDGDLDSAVAFSKRVKDAMDHLHTQLETIVGVRIRLKGGDDLVAEFSDQSTAVLDFDRLRGDFEESTGTTISAGLGSTVQEALESLRRAKLQGKDRLVGRVGGK